MHRSLRPALAAAGLVAALALPSAALAAGGQAPNLQCDSSQPFYTGTYNNVYVPPQQTCNISSSTIYGSVTVGSAASLDLNGSGSVGGNVIVGSQASAYEDSGWTIGGSALGNGAGTVSISGEVHGIAVNNTSVLSVSSATVDGDILSNGGGFGGSIGSSAITGSVYINGTTGGANATWFIAGPQNDGSPQDIGGNLQLTNNQATIYVLDNHVHRNLACYRNTPPPFTSYGGTGNQVDGQSLGQCATPNPLS